MPFDKLQYIKITLASITIAWMAVSWWATRRNAVRVKVALDVILVLLVPLAVGAYFDFGSYPKFGQFQNPHDTFHYYMGAKYSREVGYLNLYPCVAIADGENHGKPSQTQIRDMSTYSYVSVSNVLQNAAAYKEPFTASRWQEFRKDVRYFDKLLKLRWPTVLQDMGYNATPVWNMIGRAVTAWVPTDRPGGLTPLVGFDLLFVAAMALAVGWAFGWRNGALALIFFCTCFWMSYTHIRGGFLRLDWVMALAIAVCLLKQGRYGYAGVAVGYAAGSRIFPIIFALGLGARMLWEVGGKLRDRVRSGAAASTLFRDLVPGRYVAFFTACAITGASLVGLSVVSDGGIAHWQAFSTKIALHNQHLAPVRTGFRTVFLMQHEFPPGGWPAYRDVARRTLDEHGWLLHSFQVFALLLTMAVVRRAEDYEAAALGYVPAFFLTAPTFYYHVMVLVPLLLFLGKRERGGRALGAIGMFGVSVALLVINQFQQLDLPLAFIMAWLLLALCVMLVATCAFAPEAGSTSPTPKRRAGAGQGKRGGKRARKNAPGPEDELDLVSSA